MDFDDVIDRRGTHSAKWDSMEALYGVSPDDGLSMWVADMDFRPPSVVRDVISNMQKTGVYGYYGEQTSALDALCWWMQERHNWTVDPNHIFTVHGLVNGTGLCVNAFTEPGDGVVLFTPVYHAFAKVIKASGRELVECPLANVDGRYEMDFDAYDAQMTGNEKMVILCSPHNPGGRVWSRAELEQVADFARRHDLILVSDEIHHDLVFNGATHTPMTAIDNIADRLVMMTATTKTFNIAATLTGNVIIADDHLRKKFARVVGGLGIQGNNFGMQMSEAAYSPAGAAWVDELVTYLDGNRHILETGLAAIPGLSPMTLESTYLSWVDFSGTGMERAEFTNRVQAEAKIAPNHGPTFGKGGDNFLRFNFATPRARVIEAVERMQKAFGDLQ